MALLDDQTWLLAFIRNQFIVSDDTSICETIIGPDLEAESEGDCNIRGFLGRRTTDDGEGPGPSNSAHRVRPLSPDIVLESENRATRRRSNTAVRLEKIRKDRDERGRIQTTRWKNSAPRRLHSQLSTGSVVSDDLDASFAVMKLEPRPAAPRSMLSFNLQQSTETDSQQYFTEYARFDGHMQNHHNKTFIVFYHLPDVPPEKVNALNITVVESARFADLVGLACLRWTQAGGQPVLKKDASHYAIRYAEATGEIDEDIPSIDSAEPVGKFGTNTLAFVENAEAAVKGSPEQIIVTVNLVDGSFSKFVFDSTDIPLSVILDKVLKKRKMNPVVRGLEYTLEKKGSAGVPLDLTQTLASHAPVRDFWMIRINSKNPANASTPGTTLVL